MTDHGESRGAMKTRYVNTRPNVSLDIPLAFVMCGYQEPRSTEGDLVLGAGTLRVDLNSEAKNAEMTVKFEYHGPHIFVERIMSRLLLGLHLAGIEAVIDGHGDFLAQFHDLYEGDEQ